MDRRNFPKLPVVQPLVFMSEDIPDSDDRSPGSIGIAFEQLAWKCLRRFGDDLHGALNGAPMHIAVKILLKTETLNDAGDAIDLVTDVLETCARTLAGRHQKTRTASRSTSFRM